MQLPILQDNIIDTLNFLPLRDLPKVRPSCKQLRNAVDMIFQRFAEGLGLLNQNDPRPIHQRVIQHVEDLKKSFENLPGNEIPNGIGKIISKETLSIDEINLLYKFRKCRDICVVWHELAAAIKVELPAYLRFRSCSIEDFFLKHLHKVKKDFPVWVSDNRIALSLLNELRLPNLNLQHVPPEIGILVSLQSLSLDRNRLSFLPSEFGNLVSLQHLDLSDNHFSSLPSEFGNLVSLQHLNLSGNLLSSLPSEFGNLVSLQYLDFNGNQLPFLLERLKSDAKPALSKYEPATEDLPDLDEERINKGDEIPKSTFNFALSPELQNMLRAIEQEFFQNRTPS